MEYVNLDLELSEYHRDSSNNETFCVSVVRSAYGEMPSDKAIPVTLKAEQRKRISQIKKRGLSREEMIERGEILGEKLVPPSTQVRRIYDKCLDGLMEGQRVRIRLTLGNYALSDLPWEYAYILPPDTPEDQKDLRGFLVLNKQISLVRYLATERRKVSLDPVEKGNLRMVVIMANPKNDPVYQDLKIEKEFEKIQGVLKGVPAIVPERHSDATIETLQDALMKPAHIFHFAGHGDFEADLGATFKTTSGHGYIILLGEEGKGEQFSADKLASLLRASQVRLAVFTACETGGTDQINAWTGVVPALIREGIPAVVGMQFAIEDENAIAFSRQFYLALAEGLPIDAAVAEGRQAISLKGKEDERDWGVPVLYLRAEEGILFPTGTQDDVTAVDKVFRALDDKIDEPAVRDLVCISKEKIKDASKQIGEMELFKTIHDALHHIEFQCLRMMEGEDMADALPVYQGDFNDAREWIQKAIQGRKKIPQILRTLSGSLESAAADFQAAVDKPGDDALKKVVSDLKLLISRFPPKLDLIISTAAGELDLNCLVDLLAQVRSTVSAGVELEDIHDSIDKLPKIRDELAELVSKHSTLQSLDSNLRTMCSAEGIAANLELATEWKLIRQERANLPPMGAIDNYLAKQESAIDKAIANHNGLDAMDRLKEYLRFVSKEFLKADTRLKNLCMELGRLNPTLQSILSKC